MRKTTASIFFFLSIIFSVWHFGVFTSIYNAMNPKQYEDYFAQYYVEPSQEIKAPAIKKNLILIYVESLERTLSREDIFNENLIKEIDSIEGNDVKHFIQNSGASWTAAGMTASQCSTPLKPLFIKLSESTQFLPNAKCLGDILKENGYEQYFVVGGNEKFAKMKN